MSDQGINWKARAESAEAENERLEAAWLEAEGKHSTEQHYREAAQSRATLLGEALRRIASLRNSVGLGPARAIAEKALDVYLAAVDALGNEGKSS